MTIFFYERLTRNQEIENTPMFCTISREWGELGIPNLVPTFLMKKY